MARKIIKTKDEKKAILIALEDTKSSKYYFASMIKDFGLSGKIIFAKHIGTNPTKVLEAITSTKDYKKYFEKQWIVIDKDDWSKDDFNGTLNRAKSLDICCAISNESYELWILLHFEKITRFTNREELNRKLKAYFVQEFKITYDKSNSDIYAIIKSRQETAIKNAKELYEYHINIDGSLKPYEHNPFTNIYELVLCIKQVVNHKNNPCSCFIQS
ncbi:MAG: RloB family protein [Sulfuricurvum sp.]